jgi:hypothetical protein
MPCRLPRQPSAATPSKKKGNFGLRLVGRVALHRGDYTVGCFFRMVQEEIVLFGGLLPYNCVCELVES